jgi:hypothetical protein
MGQQLDKILSVASCAFLEAESDSPWEELNKYGHLGAGLHELLSKKNGFFCFEQALRVFPSETTEISLGFRDWNFLDLWKYEYKGLVNEAFCFAEDIFGGQFCFSRNAIGLLDPETGEIKHFADNLEEWAAKVLSDYDFVAGFTFAHEWQKLNGRLPGRYRLLPKQPFVLNGKYEIDNFESIDAVRLMRSYGNLAHQIHDLPDGTKVRFEVL